MNRAPYDVTLRSNTFSHRWAVSSDPSPSVRRAAMLGYVPSWISTSFVVGSPANKQSISTFQGAETLFDCSKWLIEVPEFESLPLVAT